MKVINILCLVFILQFANKTVAHENDFFVSYHLSDYGSGRVDDRFLRWAYYGGSVVRKCLSIELIDPMSPEDQDELLYVIEDAVEICELYIDDGFIDKIMNFSRDLSGAYLEDIKIGESEVTFKAELHLLGPSISILECTVPIKDKKIQPVECITVGDEHDIP